MMSQDKVSLIIPVFNVEPYLVRCLDSVLCSDHKELEVILVDDASSDKSSEIAKQYTRENPGFIYLLHEENKGPSAARNTGLQHASGDWISFLDSDDWVEPDYISAMYTCAKDTNADIVACAYDHVWDSGRVDIINPFGNLTTESDHHKKVALLRNHVVTRLYKRRLFDETDIAFPEHFRRSEDLAISPALLSYAEKISIVPRALYHYYQRADSISNRNLQRQDYSFLDDALLYMKKKMKPGYEKEAEARFIMELLYSKVMLQFSSGYTFKEVKKDISRFTNLNPDWQQNKYIEMFPSLKEHFVKLAGKGHLFPVWLMTKGWMMIKQLKKRD